MARERSEHGHFIFNHSINPRHTQGGVQCDGEVSMGKKYIVEIGRLERLYKAFIGAHGKPEITWLSPEVDLTPYTEPDMEQVKKEAYDKGYENGFIAGHLKAEKSGQSFYEDGYQCGLNDAWEAARKIASDNAGQNYSIFGQHFTVEILNTHSASEVIEKIRQYEQEKEELKKEQFFTAEEVMRQYLDTFCKGKSCTGCPLHTPDFTCGRGYHFLTNKQVSDEEVRKAYAAVLAKMKE